MAFLEPRRRRAENEIHVTGNVTIFKILPAAVQQNRVLPAQKAAVAEHRAVAVHAHGQRLSDRARGIFKRDIFRREIVRVNCRRGRVKSADGFAVRTFDVGVEVASENCLFRVFADEMEKAFLALDINQFLVSARFEVDDHRIGPGAGRHGHDGGLHIGELAAAVGGNDDVDGFDR